MSKIVNIEYVGIEPVYNMEVDVHHNYSIEGGLIVHNCAESCRYFHMSRPIKAKPDEETLTRIAKHKQKLIKQIKQSRSRLM